MSIKNLIWLYSCRYCHKSRSDGELVQIIDLYFLGRATGSTYSPRTPFFLKETLTQLVQ